MAVKTVDVTQKHKVTLVFLLDEEVTPQLFAEKIANACGGRVLQPGEAIMVERAKIACMITDETLSLPSFGYQWRSTLKRRKRKRTRRRFVSNHTAVARRESRT